MTAVEFPKQLKSLLEDSPYRTPLRALAERVGDILHDNKLPFFPDYTDHGIDHVNRVLQAEVSLVPDDVWNQSAPTSKTDQLLCDADAAVIVGATLLHDIAMHLRADGFLELIAPNTRFRRLEWFDENHNGHTADRPWKELWEDYVREARRFSDRVLTNIVGPDSVHRGWKFQNLPDNPGEWERNHCLVVGEFIRRHHARLAHEIAIYGFPGLPADSSDKGFPALAAGNNELAKLADLIGLAARSHGTSLRVCKAYLDSSPLYAQTPRPLGSAVLFPMALLRVADYLQIDRQRAPAVLLQLRNPQSPVSLAEWSKHRAVQTISPADDPRGKMVTVSQDIPLKLYLQLRELLDGVQNEMDHSTAVLDEAYGARTDLGLDKIGLATRRVYCNLNSPAFRDRLPYVPERTGFETDPNLLTLLVEPLYGEHPEVGVRELIQNAVDAVRELQAWCKARDTSVDSLELAAQECDVLVDFVERDDGAWLCRVTDRGIGMTSDTIRGYLLRGGASFRQSADWTSEFADDEGKPRVLRAGRFGIGVFATFLLGTKFRVSTRHVGENEPGYFVEADADGQLIEIQRRDDLPIGTTVEVELSDATVASFKLHSDMEVATWDAWNDARVFKMTDWFCWDWPVVSRRITTTKKTIEIEQEYRVQIARATSPPGWSVIHPDGFDAVYWSFDNFSPRIVCNGLRVASPEHSYLYDADFAWPASTRLSEPIISVVDSEANLPLRIQRYELARRRLPFLEELVRDVMLSFIGHALVCGPNRPPSTDPAGPYHCQHPLLRDKVSKLDSSIDKEKHLLDGKLRWCSSSREFVPIDPWLYSLFQCETCHVYGTISVSQNRSIVTSWPLSETPADHPTLCWDVESQTFARLGAPYLNSLRQFGVRAVGHHVVGSRVIVSVPDSDFDLDHTSGVTAKLLSRAGNKTRRTWYELTSGRSPSTSRLETLMEEIEQRASKTLEESGQWTGNEYHVLYVAEFVTEPTHPEPESPIAKVWDECLGPRAIPFDPDARRALIEHGRQHAELRRHIEAWEEMKRSGSKWVNE